MNPIEYVESVKERLSTDSIVVSYDVIREFANLEEGFIRVRAGLTNGDILDFSDYTILILKTSRITFTKPKRTKSYMVPIHRRMLPKLMTLPGFA